MGLSSPDYGIVVEENVKVPMRDGVRLATDIYRPAVDGEPVPGPLPTILGRTSYDKTWQSLWVEPVANYFTPRGYAVVLQDLRGRGKSEGVGQYFHTANVHEGEDGYDTVEWVAAQPWSNGRVGMTGSSHGGIVQTVAALTRPPHLTTIWVDVAPTNIFAHEAREGGAMSLWMFAALFLHAHDAPEIRDDREGKRMVLDGWQNIRELVQSMPFKPGETPLRAVPNLEKTLFDYYHRGEYDEFWAMKACNQEPHFMKSADIPGVFSGGWYDPFAVAMTDQYVAMAAKNGTPQRLDMGPWNHSGRRSGATSAGDVDFGPDASYGTEGYGAQRLRWFDRWLKDIPNGVEDDSPVHIFVMGGGDGRRNEDGRLNHGGRWRAEREWPPARTEHRRYYLRAGGGLSTEQPGRDEPSSSYTHDPHHPVPTISATSGIGGLLPLPDGFDPETDDAKEYMRPIYPDGGAHQKEEPALVGTRPPYPLLADRPDVLVFQTEPLEADVELTGAAEVNLWISSSAPDTDFTAKVLDVYPPSEDYPSGYHLNVADSIIRARYRNGFDRAEMMEPGETYSVRIILPPISNLFKAGHRIRIDIAGSNFPRFDVNPNTGEPMGRHTHMVTARNTVYLDGGRASHVVLPVVATE
ncbi:MAG: CocE/NonD family hydrolase [Chloroflexi bacterium]|nr:CocE/NonD family hydrolase [Chloroflexota bacterium]